MKRTITLMIVSAWLLVPTGTPDDVVAWFLINKLGPMVYGLLLLGIIIWMWYHKINLEKIQKTMKGLFKKVFK